MQIAIRPALNALAAFNVNPTCHNASLLVEIPVLYDILMHEEKNDWKGTYTPSVRGLCQWIHDRGDAILKKLIVHDIPPMKAAIGVEENDWQMVSCK